MLDWHDDEAARLTLIREVEMAMEEPLSEGRPDLAAAAAVDMILRLAWDRVREVEGGIEVKLQKPIKAYGKEIAILEFRPLLGKDLRASESGKSDMAKTMILVQRSANIPPSTVDGMIVGDVVRCGEAVNRFFANDSPIVGSKSPQT